MFFLQKMSKLLRDLSFPSREGAAALSAHVFKELCPVSKVQHTVLLRLVGKRLPPVVYDKLTAIL